MMAHLLNIWSSIGARLSREDQVLLLFDYDGTLTPIAPRPEDAVLSEDVWRGLESLAAHPRYVAGIVSGRSLEDLSNMANVPGLIHAGNHGMEIQAPGWQFTHPGAVAARDILDEAQRQLAEALAHIPGILVEHKGLTLTVHYRATPDAMVEEVEAIMEAVARPHVDAGQLRLTQGKKVVEVRPAIPWDKGKAIEKIREECGGCPYPVYFGDDRTDEDGFRVVQDMGGLAVFVGESRDGTMALHQLDTPAEVAVTLRLFEGV